ncbi:MAG: plasmid recombination protein, partial [Eubacteriaceae bacterium]|nr:plasmid recombination protein [Eubacteriaceae bacterium]
MASLKTYRYENAGKMLEHTSRKHAQTRDKHIDTVRSYTNRMLSPDRGMDDMQYLDKRIGEVAHTARKTLKVMGSWVVTVPKDILYEKTSLVDTFFDKVYDFMTERYGEINTVSCWVHYDEAVPHMHYNFVPVVYDEE